MLRKEVNRSGSRNAVELQQRYTSEALDSHHSVPGAGVPPPCHLCPNHKNFAAVVKGSEDLPDVEQTVSKLDDAPAAWWVAVQRRAIRAACFSILGQARCNSAI